MPEHYRGLLYFQDNAEQFVAERVYVSGFYENIIELALEALQSKRNDPVDHIINMPEFRIDTNIEATKLLRMVNMYQCLFEIICLFGCFGFF